MLEGRKEFGMRGRSEKAPEPTPASDFERDRPMFERLRRTNSTIDDLLTRLDAISAHQGIGQGVLADDKEKNELKRQVREAYEAQL